MSENVQRKLDGIKAEEAAVKVCKNWETYIVVDNVDNDYFGRYLHSTFPSSGRLDKAE